MDKQLPYVHFEDEGHLLVIGRLVISTGLIIGTALIMTGLAIATTLILAWCGVISWWWLLLAGSLPLLALGVLLVWALIEMTLDSIAFLKERIYIRKPGGEN